MDKVENKKLWFVVIVVALIISGLCFVWFYCSTVEVGNAVSEAPARNSQLSPRRCAFVPQSASQVECYWFTTESVDATAFKLPVVVFRSEAPSVSPDPLVYLSGGPGESEVTGSTSLSFWDDWLSRVKIERDFVLLDLRGSNTSVPTLSCDEYYEESRRMFDHDLSFAQEFEQFHPVVAKCLEHLDKQFTQGMSGFSSLSNANDIRNLLIALGYQRWSYMGVSYGTRVALVAALTQPEVKSLILDSPYIFSQGLLSDAPELWFKAINQLFKNNAEGGSDGDGESIEGESIEGAFKRVMRRLKEHPIKVKVEDWTTNRPVRWLLNSDRFVSLVYSSLYSSESEKELIDLIDALALADVEENSLYDYFYNQVFDASFNSMLYLATECNDNPLVSEAEFEQSLSKAGFLAPLFEQDWHWDICKSPLFRPGQLPEMKTVKIPVLVAAGELDPITTQEHAEQLGEYLQRGYRLELMGASHGEFFSGACAERLIPRFLLSGEVDEHCELSD